MHLRSIFNKKENKLLRATRFQIALQSNTHSSNLLYISCVDTQMKTYYLKHRTQINNNRHTGSRYTNGNKIKIKQIKHNHHQAELTHR